ncbi:MAG: LysR family transcriptional regulator [Pseudomonadota bacterium]
MDNWDEIKTAYQVARMGTVSGAAEVLGVHHATVIRHIDALEGRLGVKLFQRHARGYTATEAGDDLFRVAQATDDQFSQLVGRIKGRGTEVSGELVVTSLVTLAPRMAPVLTAFQVAHPDVVVRYLTGERLFRLEYGEAHVAIRAGTAPDQPDNVVQPFVRQSMGLYATKGYVEAHGVPDTIHKEMTGHRFVSHDNEDNRAPFHKWLRSNAPADAITFRSTDVRAMEQAVLSGAGIGFLPVLEARANPDLVEMQTPQEDWAAPLWLVTHVDLHRTNKVQAFLSFLKDASKSWQVI